MAVTVRRIAFQVANALLRVVCKNTQAARIGTQTRAGCEQEFRRYNVSMRKKWEINLRNRGRRFGVCILIAAISVLCAPDGVKAQRFTDCVVLDWTGGPDRRQWNYSVEFINERVKTNIIQQPSINHTYTMDYLPYEKNKSVLQRIFSGNVVEKARSQFVIAKVLPDHIVVFDNWTIEADGSQNDPETTRIRCPNGPVVSAPSSQR